jgi:hypothetical protein
VPFSFCWEHDRRCSVRFRLTPGLTSVSLGLLFKMVAPPSADGRTLGPQRNVAGSVLSPAARQVWRLADALKSDLRGLFRHAEAGTNSVHVAQL